MANRHTDNQLISGFYTLESGAWRWTGKTFKVRLGVSQQVATSGGELVLQGVFPDVAVQHLGSVTIAARIGNSDLPPQTFTKAGELIYRVPVPPSVVQPPSTIVEFHLDRGFQVAGDLRGLGIIASMIRLDTK